jgi:outer membrane protein OmpA-like peptidoglycan-associated protein
VILRKVVCAIFVGLVGIPGTVLAQDTANQTQDEQTEGGLTILFDSGNWALAQDQQQVLDQAARLFRDGNPIVMIVTGTADTIGNPAANLDLSIRRARSVADGLVARGIPVQRLQVLGQGNSELPVATDDEVANDENRSVRITWR